MPTLFRFPLLASLGLTVIFSLATPRTSRAAPPLLVLIDPGHGGRDHGTENNGVSEAAITLSVGKRLAERLRRDKNFRVRMTRDQDQAVSLPERVKLAKEASAELFLSIHVNSSRNSRAKGAEFYFQNQLPPDEESLFLAHQENAQESLGQNGQTYAFLERTRLQPDLAVIVTDLLDTDRIVRSSQLAKTLKLNWHGSRKSKTNSVRQAPFRVLSQITIPSALVELGFLTNDQDFHELITESCQNKMAEDLYRGLLQYRESITTGHAPR